MNYDKYINKIKKKNNHYLKLSSIIEENIYKFNEAMLKLAKELTDEYNKVNNIKPEVNDDVIKDKDSEENKSSSRSIGKEKIEHYSVKNSETKKYDKKSKLIKKLYFKISVHIHPDKTNDIEKIKDFYIIKESLENNILYKLLIVADKYNIKYNFLKEYCSILDNENIILDNMIDKISKSIVLKWAKEKDPFVKLDIIKKHMLG